MHKNCFENHFAQIKRGLNIIAMVGKQEFSTEKGFYRMSI